MRVGIATEYYRPWPGGISEHVHHEATELARRGHEVTILSGPASVRAEQEREAGCSVRVLRLGFELRFTSNGALSRMLLGRFLVGLRRLLRELRLDVLHVHAPLDPCLGWAAVAASSSPAVGTFHASFEAAPLWDLLYRALRPLSRRVFDRLDGRICVSGEAERSIAHYFPASYEIIPNGVDTERFHPRVAPASFHDGDRPTALFVGRSDPRKGLALLLRAFGEVRRRVPRARLVVAGVGEREGARLLPGAGAAPGRDVVFAGYVDPEKLPGYYRACDVFCSPATGRESQGIVLLEAMAAARASVAFAIPGYRDVVTHARDGWLVPEVGVASLADAIATLLSKPELRDALGRAGRETALRYAWPQVAERLEGSFERARGARRRARGGG